jgi:putative two-component system response regulator
MPSQEAPQDARILIVDDEEANVRLLERALAQEGYTSLSSTTDSRQVLALFAERQPDLLMLDLRMPHLDGFAVMESLYREIPDAVEVPILILTADDTPENKRKALAAGARDFLTKPLDLAEVLARVQNLLEIRFLRSRLAAQDEALMILRELAESSSGTKQDDP